MGRRFLKCSVSRCAPSTCKVRISRSPLVVMLLAGMMTVGCGSERVNTEGFQRAQPGERTYYPLDAGVAESGVAATAEPTVLPGQASLLGPVVGGLSQRERVAANALAGGRADAVEQLPTSLKPPALEGKPVGPIFMAELVEGQHASFRATLEPGLCYVIAGAASTGVRDFRLNLIAAPPRPPQVLAQSEVGSSVLSGFDGCLRAPGSLSMETMVDMQMVAGTGTLASRLYQK